MSIVLYEPLPVGRIGVRPDDQTVIVASDFSTFGSWTRSAVAARAIIVGARVHAGEC